MARSTPQHKAPAEVESFRRSTDHFDPDEILGLYWQELPGGQDGKGESYELPLDRRLWPAFKRVEIELRYKRKQKKFDPRAIQLTEINRLCRHRYGSDELPDDEIGRNLLYVLAHCLVTLTDARTKLLALFKRAPWLTPDEARDLLRSLRRPRRFRATTLGKKFQVTAGERRLLRLTQMRAVDAADPTAPESRRERNRRNQERRRRRQGRQPRQEYLAKSLSWAKPWEQLASREQLGIGSRRPIRA